MNPLVKLHRLGSALDRFDLLTPGLKPAKAYINWLRANYQMMRKVSCVTARPLKLTVESTNACQLRCPLCPTGLRIIPRPRSSVRLDLFERLLDEVGDYVFFIDFHNWGEPLLNNQLENFIRLARGKMISTTISTNLSLKLTDERLRSLILSGLNHMIVSLDGASKETVTMYRRGMDFDLVISNMRRLVALKKEMNSKTPYISWQFLVFRFNEHELEKAQEMARDIGVDRLMFSHASLDTDVYPLSEEERAAIRTWVPMDPSLTSYDRKNLESCPSAPLKFNKNQPTPHRCDWLYVSSTLNSDGTISPCCAVYKGEDSFSIPDCLEISSFMDVYNNERYRAVRDKFAGRNSRRLGVACEHCSNGDLMRDAQGVNRIILLSIGAKLINAVLCPG